MVCRYQHARSATFKTWKLSMARVQRNSIRSYRTPLILLIEMYIYDNPSESLFFTFFYVPCSCLVRTAVSFSASIKLYKLPCSVARLPTGLPPCLNSFNKRWLPAGKGKRILFGKLSSNLVCGSWTEFWTSSCTWEATFISQIRFIDIFDHRVHLFCACPKTRWNCNFLCNRNSWQF